MSRKTKKIIFDASWHDYQMRNNKLTCGFNMPEALSGKSSFGLPPYAKRMPYLVDEYPACPQNWMRSEGRTKSFFVPVEEGKGMWLDFNECSSHTHEVAIVISVQGINPITGLPCNDPQLEQYIDECPKHKIKFGPDRYCKECDFRWTKQNYICTNATPFGSFWIDGFKAADGIVRQYILTAEKMRGVASNVIGKDRVYAIGLSFFLSKEKKPEIMTTTYRSRSPQWFSHVNTNVTITPDMLKDLQVGDVSDFSTYSYYLYDSTNLYNSTKSLSNNTSGQKGMIKCSEIDKSIKKGKRETKGIKAMACLDSMRGSSLGSSIVREVKTKNLEVGAGAKINQSIYDDPESLDFWHDEPEAITCINYCTEKEAKEIIEQGKVDVEGNEEGFLKDIPVGN